MSPGPLRRVRGVFARLSGPAATGAGTGDSGRDALRRVRVAATRVALVSTAIVAAVYLVIAVVVVLIVTARETSSVDAQLSQALATSTYGNGLQTEGTSGSPLWYWLVATDGTQFVCDPQAQSACTIATADGIPASAAAVGTSEVILLYASAVRFATAACDTPAAISMFC